ncbi:hypothetical protein [Microlunatus soli]|uniref:Uncharacterized protein n=1 Tax=Microlunatus soli TaxID=630515 RepID=A0A1H1XCY1_9ACTN|nr:hypothetical protein [Microlunatus soli]SDT07188.1 hypothetical protein SAMN04489812_4032 [Microlunatus soli]
MTQDVELTLTQDEALVVYDWLTRFNLADGAVDHHAERRVLWDLESALESKLTAPLSERYPQLLAAARDRVQGRADESSRETVASPTRRLLASADLPDGFVYPPLFLRVVELGLVELEPWSILHGEQLINRVRGIRDRYPQRKLVPFARRVDRDDVACFDLATTASTVRIIEDFGEPGFELFESYDDFAGWLHAAVQDLIEFEE